MATNLAQKLDKPRSLRSIPRIIMLDESFKDEVCQLESRCYSSPWSSELIAGEFRKEISYRLGVLVGGKLCAYAFSYLIPEELHLLNIAVDPQHRRRGLGRYLLSTLLWRSLLRGVRYVYLEVRKSNHVAQKLYSEFGFRVVGVRKKYYRDNGEDALVLELELSVNDTKRLEKLSRSTLNQMGFRID